MERIIIRHNINQELIDWCVVEFGSPSTKRWGWMKAQTSNTYEIFTDIHKFGIFRNVVLFVNREDAILFKMMWG